MVLRSLYLILIHIGSREAIEAVSMCVWVGNSNQVLLSLNSKLKVLYDIVGDVL